jgi:hypothetical protein
MLRNFILFLNHKKQKFDLLVLLLPAAKDLIALKMGFFIVEFNLFIYQFIIFE